MRRNAAYTPKVSVQNAVRPLLGRKYKLGGNGTPGGEPFDCFGLVVEYSNLRYSTNILAVHSESGYDFDSYAGSYAIDATLAKGMFKKYLDKFFLKMALGFIRAGDLLWCSLDGDEFAGIYAGLQKIIVTTPDTGCMSIGTEHYVKKDAYRCPLLSL